MVARTCGALRLGAAVAASALLLAACGQSSRSDLPTAHPGDPAARADGSLPLPSAHVHGVGVDPADGHVYLAAHDGLYRMSAKPERVGPVIDLMGFAIAGPNHFYASGHPGTATDLPNPVGLIETRDGGKTWTVLSRQGQSDFHALTVSLQGVVGFDGALRASRDGLSWTQLAAPVQPHALAASPDGRVLLATSQRGPLRSTDGGATWQPIPGAPLLQTIDWADAADLVVGVTPGGEVAVSQDAGGSWKTRGTVDGAPQAVAASGRNSATLRVLVVTDTELLDSRDGAASFEKFRPEG